MSTVRDHQNAMLTMKLVGQGVPLGTIRFFTAVYPLFLEQDQASCTEMADYVEKEQKRRFSAQAAAYHVGRLTQLGHLSRVHFRAWELSQAITETLDRE